MGSRDQRNYWRVDSLLGVHHKTPLALMMDEGVEPRDEDTCRSSVTGMAQARVPGSRSGFLAMLHSTGHK